MSDHELPVGDSWARAAHNKPGTTLNEYYSGSLKPQENNLAGFQNFLLLPPEIRWIVWQYALPCRRYISIRVNPPRDDHSSSPLPLIGGSTHMGADQEKGAHAYSIELVTNHRYSPLLAVNQEARRVFLEFYRIRLSCTFRNKLGMRYVYFNPESDILNIDTCTGGGREPLVELVSDVTKSDPLGIGIQHMSIGGRVSNSQLPRGPYLHEPEAVNIFKKTIFRLKSLFFTAHARVEARLMCDRLRNIGVSPRYNRSFPLHSLNEEFDFLETDPRPISPDINEICLGNDPGRLIYAWEQMEKAFGIDRATSSTHVQFLVTAIPGHKAFITPTMPLLDIHSHQIASENVTDEEAYWRYLWGENSPVSLRKIYKFPDTEEKIATVPLPAIGFWLLPIDVLGPLVTRSGTLPSGHVSDNSWVNMRLVNWINCRPKLWLSRLD